MHGPPNLETILRTGQILGAQYRVDGLIAKGGMAAVWAGVNQHTGKRVALKVILHSFASNGGAAELFRREALAASKVNHPNVVDIFDVIDYEGTTCIVMELLDGETLGSYLARNGHLSLQATVALLLPAMRGVAAVNAQGVVHRDLKPGNIFLCSDPDGRLLTTKVLDFGISVMMKRAGETSTAIEPLAMFGTPAYMAPEAIESSPNIDGRADVYGFGVLFFEMLTGKLPFPGPPGVDLLKHILTDPPPKVTLYRPDLSSEVVQMIDCALAKNANDRFPDMEHLIRATEDQLQTPPSTASALPPISSLPVIPSARSDFGAAVPMAGAGNDKEPSARAHLIETRVLYSLANEPVHATDGAGLARKTQLSPANTPQPASRDRRRTRRLLDCHGMGGCARVVERQRRGAGAIFGLIRNRDPGASAAGGTTAKHTQPGQRKCASQWSTSAEASPRDATDRPGGHGLHGTFASEGRATSFQASCPRRFQAAPAADGCFSRPTLCSSGGKTLSI